jgi:hypothetical protein
MLTGRVGDYFVCTVRLRGARTPRAEPCGVLRALIIYIVRVS